MKNLQKQKAEITVEDFSPSSSDVPVKETKPKIVSPLSGSENQSFTDTLLIQVLSAVWIQGATKEDVNEKMSAAIAD